MDSSDGRAAGSASEPAHADRRAILRAERQRLGLTQAELAAQARVAPETLRKYESGGRTPTRASIERLLQALQVPHVPVRAILHELGFAAAETLFTPEADPDYQFTVPQLRVFVEENPWPQFAVNNLLEQPLRREHPTGLP